MPTIQLHRATNPPTPEAVHINPGAVLFVESAPELQVGQTLVQVYSQTKQSIRVLESVQHLLGMLPDHVALRRHYHAGAPLDGGSIVYVCKSNVASIDPNTPLEPMFWTITFKDQFVLRVMAPSKL